MGAPRAEDLTVGAVSQTPSPIDLHLVQALVDTRFASIPETHRAYFQSDAGHWLVRFSPVDRDEETSGDAATGRAAGVEYAMTGLGWVEACYVHGETGEIRVPAPPAVPLPVGYTADSVHWEKIFPV